MMKRGKGKNTSTSSSGLLPNSLKIISSCLKTVSATATSAARSAVSASISSDDHRRDQVTWAGFDKLELSPTTIRRVLLLGYQNGFQVLDVEDASNFSEVVSKRDGPVAFLQMLPLPLKLEGNKGSRELRPLLLVVAGDQPGSLGCVGRDHVLEPQSTTSVNSPTAVSFYSLRSSCFVQMLKFRSDVCMVKCSSKIVAVGLATQIYCIDALTLESKFSVLTYPVPQFGGKGPTGVNFGYGPMAVGPRWLAYTSDNLISSKTGRLSPKNVAPSPGVSPSASPGAGGGSRMTRYAMESSKQLAAGIINLGDVGYKTTPLGPISGWKVARTASSEMDNAGMVVVKDFVSRTVISQFRAHTRPISALCFDPSGTLLVTASVHGNNINVFRIMPSGPQNGSGNSTHDWSSAHVHLYKLHRGITTAIIQDICFSQYSQWIAVTSNKGTCHIYVLSPFGGEVGFENISSRGKESSQYPILSLPWWSTPSFINNHHPPPPLPVTISVVSRIRDGNSGLLKSVTTSASSAGKVAAPSGAIAAIFHNSMSTASGNISDCLEHLLVYTPSGHLVQYALMPLISSEPIDNGVRSRPVSFMHTQDEELRVKVEPFQWWDACRRSDWPEREESISGPTPTGQEMDGYNYRPNILEGNKCVRKKHPSKNDKLKLPERSHWYLANAEVQINSGKLPLSKRSKVRFLMMNPPRIENCVSGELDVTQIATHEVELKWKDLLPVFDHFHCTKSTCSEREILGGANGSSSSMGLDLVGDKVSEETVICHSNPASLSSTESSDGGSSRRTENLPDLDRMTVEKPIMAYYDTGNILNQNLRGAVNTEFSLLKEKPLAVVHLPSQLSIKSNICSSRRAVPDATSVLGAYGFGQEPILTIDHFDSATNMSSELSTPSNPQNLVDLEPFFHEGYCKSFEVDEWDRLVEDVTEDLNEKHGKSEVHGDYRESDDLLGCMFPVSEEG